MNSKKYPALFKGAIVPIITTSIHSDIFSVIDHIQRNHISMIFLLGTTGEALKIKHEEKIELIKNVATYIKSNVQLLVGITSPNLKESIELMKVADQAGAFASVISPLVVDNDSTAVMNKLLSASPGNLMLYNFPKFSGGRHISIRDIKAWVSEPRILGIKDSSGDFEYFEQLLEIKKINPHFKVYFGPEEYLIDALKMDIDGFVPSSGNLEPGLADMIWKEKETAPWDQWYALKSLIQETDENYISAIKRLLKERGLISNEHLIA